MKLHKEIIVFSLLVLVYSCSNDIPTNMKETLKLAGENKKELMKVVKHYKNDSLKLEAAYFLITNMKYHGYYEIEDLAKYDALFDSIANCHPQVESDDEVFNFILRSKLVDNMVNRYLSSNSIGNYKGLFHSDLQTLDAEFLIENIDYAFKAWELPWAKCYTFNEFCKYILPYRYGSEAPEKWRKRFYDEFSWIADSTSDAVTAIEMINKIFRNKIATSHNLKKLGNHIKVEHLITGMVVESCEGQTGLGVCVLRSIGLPVTTIVMPWWGNRAVGHKMNALLDSSKTWQYFAFDDWDPSLEVRNFAPKMFLNQFDQLSDEENIYRPYLLDAGSHFQNVKTICLDVEYNKDINLGIFGNLSWAPISRAKKDLDGIAFENIGLKDVMFITGIFNNGQFKPSTYPFTTDSTGYPHYYMPDTSKIITLEIDRKFPPNEMESRCKALLGGIFEISNNENFENARSVFTINEILKYRQNELTIPPVKAKYIRFLFPQGVGSCTDGPAEISFYSSDSTGLKRLEGRYYGSPQLSKQQISILTDNDILSYVEWRTFPRLVGTPTDNVIIKRNEDDTVWIAMELDTLTEITHIGICPRNDKNSIYYGMYYELLFWDNKWESLGAKYAQGETIKFENVPSNSVLWLRNHTEGKEERIFTIDNGKQVWW